jgi:hypothetical protein
MGTTALPAEGTIPFHGYSSWYRIVGDHDEPGKLPLLTLHGGPGVAHDSPDPEVYHTMNGPSEFHVIGRLKDWDVRHRLGEIRVPTLITSGHYDESTPTLNETLHRGLAGSRWVIFEHSAHMAHIEETERYVQVLDQFLSGVEG